MSLVRADYRQSAAFTWVLYLLAMHALQSGLCMHNCTLHILPIVGLARSILARAASVSSRLTMGKVRTVLLQASPID
jgi:hypothetical protein